LGKSPGRPEYVKKKSGKVRIKAPEKRKPEIKRR
jgi:hypothetical protein